MRRGYEKRACGEGVPAGSFLGFRSFMKKFNTLSSIYTNEGDGMAESFLTSPDR